MAAMFRALAKPISLVAGVGAAAVGAISGAFPQAQNACQERIKEAYRKFMPVMDYPDLSTHNNCLKKVLTPQLYAKLRNFVSFLYFIIINLISYAEYSLFT